MNPNANDGDPGYRRQFPGPNEQNRPYRLSPDEIRVLKDCNNESFFKRSIPFSAFLACSTYLGVKNGFLKPSAKYGPTPKVFVSAVVGYFVGKFSYQGKCAERLMQLPNSQLGEMLRQKRRWNRQETFDPGFGSGMSLGSFGNIASSDLYSDLNPNSSLDLDTTRPENPGLDDYSRPSLDNPVFEDEEEMPPIQKQVTTYDELRRKNREEYQQKRLGNYTDFAQPNVAPTPQIDKENYSEQELNTRVSPQPPRNKYGDTWG